MNTKVDYSKKKIRKLIKHNEEMVNEQRTFQDLINRKEHEGRVQKPRFRNWKKKLRNIRLNYSTLKKTKTNDEKKNNDIKTLGDKNKLLQSEIASLQKKVKEYESAQKTKC
ncbi:hypothetical protein RCO48_22460 [Peribacillus frigoritolerans]|nr:hypothetical protein [Peribacillus frigoritolerans]